MARLSHDQVMRISRAAVLLESFAGVLSAFEAGLLREIGERFVAFGVEAAVSKPEWDVLDDAVAAMSRAKAALRTPCAA